jgi:hypothetical protein
LGGRPAWNAICRHVTSELTSHGRWRNESEDLETEREHEPAHTRSVAVDLTTRAVGARAVKGGIVIDWMPKAGGDKPGQTQGVIAIIRPEGGAR